MKTKDEYINKERLSNVKENAEKKNNTIFSYLYFFDSMKVGYETKMIFYSSSFNDRVIRSWKLCHSYWLITSVECMGGPKICDRWIFWQKPEILKVTSTENFLKVNKTISDGPSPTHFLNRKNYFRWVSRHLVCVSMCVSMYFSKNWNFFHLGWNFK